MLSFCHGSEPPAPEASSRTRLTDGAGRAELKTALYHAHRVAHYWLADPERGIITVHRWHPAGYLDVLAAERNQRVRVEPFDQIELAVGVLFGDDEDAPPVR
jgi:hypothetical protein